MGVNGNRAYFKQCTRDEALAAKRTMRGCTMYVVSDPDAKKAFRMVKAVKGEGMPTYRNPFLHGNLFILLTIDFPGSLTAQQQQEIRSILPPPLNVPKWNVDDHDVESHIVTEQDPVQSYEANKVNMLIVGEAYDDDEDTPGGGSMPGGQGMQCQQQ